MAPKEAGGPRPRRRPTCVESQTTTEKKVLCSRHLRFVFDKACQRYGVKHIMILRPFERQSTRIKTKMHHDVIM